MDIPIALVEILFFVLVCGLGWLAWYSLRRDSSNADGSGGMARDSTIGAYARRSKELAAQREAELPPTPATGSAKLAEVHLDMPETRIGQ